MIKIITTQIEFQQLESEWNALYNIAIVRTPFQSFSFNWTSWNNFLSSQKQNKIWIVCNREKNNKLTGIVPLYIDNKGILRFINDLHLDFGDGLFEKKENSYFIVKNITECISKTKEIKGVQLINLTEKSKCTL